MKKVDVEFTERGKIFLENSFLVSIDKKRTACLTKQTIVEKGSPFNVRTYINGRQIRLNMFNKLEDAKRYCAMAFTQYARPDGDIQLKITDTDKNDLGTYTADSDFKWFTLKPEECEYLLPVEMMNSNLHRRSINRFHIRHNEYNPFIAKEY